MASRKKGNFWDRAMRWSYQFTIDYRRPIAWSSVVLLILCAWGISMISTNYSIIRNMPNGKKITSDFKYFEENLTGFRPMEFAITAKGNYQIRDYEVIRQIDAVEQYLRGVDAVRGYRFHYNFIQKRQPNVEQQPERSI